MRSLVLGDLQRPGSEAAYRVGPLRCHGDSKPTWVLFLYTAVAEAATCVFFSSFSVFVGAVSDTVLMDIIVLTLNYTLQK